LGVEADYTNNFNKQGNAACTCDVNPDVSDKFAVMNRQQGSLRGRIGYALNHHLLPFVMAGGSVASLGTNYRDEGGDYYSRNGARAGWLVGAGLEWRFAQSWSIRGEYYYNAYNNALKMRIPLTYGLNDPNGKARVSFDANNIRAAINYWF
jgi:opacity protein-like surface antigen